MIAIKFPRGHSQLNHNDNKYVENYKPDIVRLAFIQYWIIEINGISYLLYIVKILLPITAVKQIINNKQYSEALNWYVNPPELCYYDAF